MTDKLNKLLNEHAYNELMRRADIQEGVAMCLAYQGHLPNELDIFLPHPASGEDFFIIKKNEETLFDSRELFILLKLDEISKGGC